MTDFPRVGLQSSMRGNGFPFVENGVLNLTRIQKAAQWSEIILDGATLNVWPQVKAKLKAYNPALKIHGYFLVAGVWVSSIPFHHAFYDLAHQYDAFTYLRGSNTLYSFTQINLATPGFADDLANLIIFHSSAYGYDGLFLDVLIPEFFSADVGEGVLDWQRYGFSTEQDFLDAWKAGAEALVSGLVAEGKPVITNYGNGFSFAAGCVREFFPTQFGGSWNTNMVQNGANKYGPVPGLINCPFTQPAGKQPWIETGPTLSYVNGQYHYLPTIDANIKKARFGLGSACLCDGFHSFMRGEWDALWVAESFDFWMREYAHPKLGKGWLGSPLAAAVHLTSQPQTGPCDLWYRKFSRGTVAVNPSTSSKSIYLPESYTQFSPVGEAGVKRAFVVPAGDAIFLLRA